MRGALYMISRALFWNAISSFSLVFSFFGGARVLQILGRESMLLTLQSLQRVRFLISHISVVVTTFLEGAEDVDVLGATCMT